MKLVVMGTGPFATLAFQALVESPHEVLALITRPSREAPGRTQIHNPMQEIAERLGVEVHAPESINSEEARQLLQNWSPDLFVVCDYGQILSSETLQCARLGGVNLHGSLLPKYRGAAPVQWALRNGDHETGVTVIHMTPRLDAGPILSSRTLTIGESETHEQLEPRLAALGVEPVLEAVAMLELWDGQSPIGSAQDPALATKAPRLKKSDGAIDWTQPARGIINQIRAFKPWPGSFTFMPRRKGGPQRLLIDHVRLVSAAELTEAGIDAPTPPGQVAAADRKRLWVQTGEGVLAIESLQPAGKRLMYIDEYLRGFQPERGCQLGT